MHAKIYLQINWIINLINNLYKDNLTYVHKLRITYKEINF